MAPRSQTATGMSITLAIVAAATLLWIVAEHLQLRLALSRPWIASAAPPVYPSLTIIRPIRGVDVDAAGNIAALLASEYPAPLELLFVFDDERDPAVPLVRAALSQPLPAGVTARVLFAGAASPGETGKLHAMAVAIREAHGELVGFSDSDTRVDADLLRALVGELLARPDAGDVFASARADGVPSTAGDAGYSLLLDVWYGGPVAALAGPRGELPFIMGQLMIFRRAALTAIGGVECAAGQLVDDMYLGERVAAAGWRNVLVPRTLHVITGGMSLADFGRLMRRWVLFSRSGLPARLTRPAYAHGVAIWLAVIAVAAGALLHAWWSIAAGTAALVAVCIGDRALFGATGRAPLPYRFAWVTLAIALAGPIVAASMWLDHRVDWRGREYALDASARLEGGR